MNPNFWAEFWAYLAERWPLAVIQFFIIGAIILVQTRRRR